MIIKKFPFAISSRWVIEMPVGARITEMGVQGAEPFFWALCDENMPMEEREFFMMGTEQAVANVECKFVKTLVVYGHLVMHIFELLDRKAAIRVVDGADPFVAIGSDDLTR